jgi:hypothetical protein
MTDGYVGNDQEIIAEIQKHPNARVFRFWNWKFRESLPSRQDGRRRPREVEYVALNDDGSLLQNVFTSAFEARC